jgi:hypothetical protein
LLALLCLSAEAGPRLPARTSGYEGGPTPLRGSIKRKLVDLPTVRERGDAVADAGSASQVPELAWASLSVRKPHVQGRAWLVFTGTDAVDGKRGIASWGMSGSASYTAPEPPPGYEDLFCMLFGCPGGAEAPTTASRAMQVWLRAQSDRRYVVVCRAKLVDAVGDIVVASEGNFSATHHIDHTGKSTGKFSFLVDPQSAGFYGFTISSLDAWSTSGCTVDELE